MAIDEKSISITFSSLPNLELPSFNFRLHLPHFFIIKKIVGVICCIIDKALAKNVEERYQAIQDLALDIKSFKRRLEFEAELERSNPPGEILISTSKSRFVVTNDETEKSPEVVTQMMRAMATDSISTPQMVQDSQQIFKSKNRVPLAIIVSVLLVGAVGSIFVWKFNSSGTTVQTAATTSSPAASDPAVKKPSLSLNYSLTVQSYNDGRYKNPFKLSGEMLFRNKDRVRLTGARTSGVWA